MAILRQQQKESKKIIQEKNATCLNLTESVTEALKGLHVAMDRADKNARDLYVAREDLRETMARADKNAEDLREAVARADKNDQDLREAREELHVAREDLREATAQLAKANAKIPLRIVWSLKFRLSHLMDYFRF